MRVDIIMPQLGESVVEGTITKWLVKPGDVIQRDQAVVEVATDKADSEVPASQAGRVETVLVQEGEVVKIGQVLCTVETDVSQPAQPSPAPSPSPKPESSTAPQPRPEQPASKPASATPQAVAPQTPPTSAPQSPSQPAARETRKAPPRDAYPDTITSPAVRRLALMYGVELAKLTGTGERGRITRDDVLRGAGIDPEEGREPPIPQPEVPPPLKAPEPAAAQPQAGSEAQRFAEQMSTAGHAPPIPGAGYQAYKVPAYAQREGDRIIPFTRRRRLIADHMVYSKHVSPHVFTVSEIDVDRTVRMREQHKGTYKAESISLTVVAFICSAVVRALREFPGLNARVLDDSYVILREINLGIAVDTPDGLLVPNIKRADELSMRGMARAIGELAARAREGKLTPDDLMGSTFSVSNPGAKGNLIGAAVISQPNVAILRTGEIKKRVVVMEGPDGADTMAIHPVMYAGLSYDHRIIDGVLANSFLWRVSEILRTGDFSL